MRFTEPSWRPCAVHSKGLDGILAGVVPGVLFAWCRAEIVRRERNIICSSPHQLGDPHSSASKSRRALKTWSVKSLSSTLENRYYKQTFRWKTWKKAPNTAVRYTWFSDERFAIYKPL